MAENQMKSKKILCLALALITLFTIGGVSAFAVFGTGYTYVAADVCVIKTGLIGQKLNFSDSDFKSAFCITDFDSITVTSIPSSNDGTLLLAGRRVKEGQTIKRRNIPALIFVPASADVREVDFCFTITQGKTATPSTCRLRFIDKINYAPKTPEDNESSLSLTTQSGISLFGTMKAADPEGDKLEYIIASYPKNGTLRVMKDGDGRYKYTPSDSFTGYDTFTYVVRDEYGNYSSPMEVGIRIIARMSEEVYVDMTERAEYNAAVAMSAMGIMSGKTLGDDKYFMPDEVVSRAEFVAMAMKACGMRADSTLTKTFFDDNEKIPTSLVSYVATAQRVGIISGDFKDGSLSFDPNRSITMNEAASIMAELMGVKGSDESVEYIENTTISASAKPSVSAMYTLGIFDGEIESLNGNESLTRASAAEYLYRMSKNR